MKRADIDILRTAPIPAQAHFIGGFAVASRDGATLSTTSAIDGSKLAEIADGGAAEIDLAVAAARRTYETGAWSGRSPMQRKKTLLAFADLMEKHALELAVLGSRDNGAEIRMSLKAEPLSAATTPRW